MKRKEVNQVRGKARARALIERYLIPSIAIEDNLMERSREKLWLVRRKHVLSIKNGFKGREPAFEYRPCNRRVIMIGSRLVCLRSIHTYLLPFGEEKCKQLDGNFIS